MKTKSKPIRKKTKKLPARGMKKKSKTIAATKATIKNVKTGSLEKKQKMVIKRAAYMALAIFLGLLIGMFLHWFVELVYINQMLLAGGAIGSTNFVSPGCYLPAFADAFFLLGGLFFGIWLGLWGWQKVYVEHKHRIFRK